MRIGETIYLDHHASTPLDPRVLAEMTPFYHANFGNPHSSEHAIGWRAAAAVDEAKRLIGELVGADADEVVLTSGATEANNLALLGLAHLAATDGRMRVLISAIEHKSVLQLGRILAQTYGLSIVPIPVNDRGHVDPDVLRSLLDSDVLLVSVAPVNNEIGTIQDVPALAAECEKVGAYFHCDAAQAPCGTSVSTLAHSADLISLSGHKIYGPSGIGALIVRRDLQKLLRPVIHGAGQQNGLRSGTLPLALCVGLGRAAQLLQSSEAADQREDLRRRKELFIETLTKLGWKPDVNGPIGEDCHPGNANLLFRGFVASEVLGALQPYIAASSGSACTSGIPEPSHVLSAIGRTTEEAEGSIRFGLGRFTTDEDVVSAANLIAAKLNGLASLSSCEFA
jgi:cysteine desulfurase